jgi:lipopolysaccharide export system protein LptC
MRRKVADSAKSESRVGKNRADNRDEAGGLARLARPPRLSGVDAYSIFVGFMKLLLPTMAVALILLVVAWPQFRIERADLSSGIGTLSLDQADKLAMYNARYEGIDKNDRPFLVTAEVASQVGSAENVVDLEAPTADITTASGTWLALQAATGRYDRDAETLDLSGGVSLYHDKGIELHTPSARVDLRAARAQGDEPVTSQGPFGYLESEGFRVERRGERIYFMGRSRMVIYPGSEGGTL